jgi:hypothetical protein
MHDQSRRPIVDTIVTSTYSFAANLSEVTAALTDHLVVENVLEPCSEGFWLRVGEDELLPATCRREYAV